MNVSFEEIGYLAVTFAAGEELEAGQVCKLDEEGKAVPCAAGDSFCGLAEGVRKDYAAVQVAGFVRASCGDETVKMGYANLCADGNGGVKAGSGREYLVVSADAAAKTVTFML